MGGRMRKDLGEKETVEDRRKVQTIPGENDELPALENCLNQRSSQESRGNEFLYRNFRNE